ncbi:acetyl-CoA carboxylase biotin carboxyl carrier protein subunit, partial [bacterium]|nr:acetyl-CoA carboxylase biotin carboxyl carrier protein subunit [bacterium]
MKPVKQSILSPLAAAVVSIEVSEGQLVAKDQIVAVLESMKMQSAIHAPVAGVVANLSIVLDATIQAGQLICEIESADAQSASTSVPVAEAVQSGSDNGLAQLNQELAYSQDDARPNVVIIMVDDAG